MVRQSILLDDNGELIFNDNDLLLGESDKQHIVDTINAAPGWWKENPSDGVNIRAYLNSSGQEQKLERAVKINLNKDGYTCTPAVGFVKGLFVVQPNITL